MRSAWAARSAGSRPPGRGAHNAPAVPPLSARLTPPNDHLVQHPEGLRAADDVRDHRLAAADLGDIEWAGTKALAEEQARLAGVHRFEVVKAKGADLLGRVLIRFGKLKAKAEREATEAGLDPSTVKVAPAWPSSAARWCTSDVKRGPIWTLLTKLAAELSHLGRPVRILNCMGQRAAESAPRAKLFE
ncbi:hypothetical protein M2271_007207 [Streptomyces sp. LBL]|uniref:hypothetical protein n=1 Tax=Streptomyces sp. LBL TaxID=2940562 RepID=UPI002476E7D3|nr:hypothetical protein [Streptomyces sp. LBL]MDH6629371.1 hypothetical protein [Streptomyces sp. LBL]